MHSTSTDQSWFLLQIQQLKNQLLIAFEDHAFKKNSYDILKTLTHPKHIVPFQTLQSFSRLHEENYQPWFSFIGEKLHLETHSLFDFYNLQTPFYQKLAENPLNTHQSLLLYWFLLELEKNPTLFNQLIHSLDQKNHATDPTASNQSDLAHHTENQTFIHQLLLMQQTLLTKFNLANTDSNPLLDNADLGDSQIDNQPLHPFVFKPLDAQQILHTVQWVKSFLTLADNYQQAQHDAFSKLTVSSESINKDTLDKEIIHQIPNHPQHSFEKLVYTYQHYFERLNKQEPHYWYAHGQLKSHTVSEQFLYALAHSHKAKGQLEPWSASLLGLYPVEKLTLLQKAKQLEQNHTTIGTSPQDQALTQAAQALKAMSPLDHLFLFDRPILKQDFNVHLCVKQLDSISQSPKNFDIALSVSAKHLQIQQQIIQQFGHYKKLWFEEQKKRSVPVQNSQLKNTGLFQAPSESANSSISGNAKLTPHIQDSSVSGIPLISDPLYLCFAHHLIQLAQTQLNTIFTGHPLYQPLIELIDTLSQANLDQQHLRFTLSKTSYCTLLTLLDIHGAYAFENKLVLDPTNHPSPLDYQKPTDTSSNHSSKTLFSQSTSFTKVKQNHWFWSPLFQEWSQLKYMLMASLLTNIFALCMPLFTMNIYDRVVPNQTSESLWALALGITIVLGLDFFVKSTRSHLIDRMNARIDVSLSNQIMHKVLSLKLKEKSENVGSFAQNLRGFESIRDFITNSTLTALVDIPFAILFLCVIAWISPWLLVPVLFVIVLMLANVLFFSQKIQRWTEVSYKASSLKNGTLIEALVALDTIKTQRMESEIQTRWDQTTRFLSKIQLTTKHLSSTANYISYFLNQFMTVLLVIVGVYLIFDHQMTTGGIIAASMIGSRALTPFSTLVALLMQYENTKTALKGLDLLMQRDEEIDDNKSYLTRPHLNGAIEFNQVSFKYPNRTEAALQNINFKIQPGERVGIIGQVGSGKSTLYKLITQLYDITDGQLKLDGVDIHQLHPHFIRSQISFVEQDPILFAGSLKENLLFNGFHSDTELLKAIEYAGLKSFVDNHPQGIDLMVGERGAFLSGGQKQAVALARAFLQNANTLLLDEPTGSMDSNTELAVMRGIDQFCSDKKTLILITHKMSLLDLVDRLIIMDKGQIISDGPKDTILKALAQGAVKRSN